MPSWPLPGDQPQTMVIGLGWCLMGRWLQPQPGAAPALADELMRWKPKARGSRPVFPARYVISESLQSIRKAWLPFVDSAGVSDMRPHDLRHNFTSVLQARGISDSIIMSITGHKTHVMLHRYSHSADASKQAAADLMPTPIPAGHAKVTKLRR